MATTAQLGTSSSYLANIELGVGASSPPPPAFTWFPMDQPGANATRQRSLAAPSTTVDYPAGLYAGYTPPPAFVWFPMDQPGALAGRIVMPAPRIAPADYPAGLYAGFTPPPASYSWMFTINRDRQDLSQMLRQRAAFVGPEMPAALLPGHHPTPPIPPFNVQGYPAIPKVLGQAGTDWQRVRKAIDTLSEVLNSLMSQGYVQRTSLIPPTWKVASGAEGVVSFEGREGAVTLLPADIITAAPGALISLNTAGTPADTSTPVAWAAVKIGSQVYYIPLYQ